MGAVRGVASNVSLRMPHAIRVLGASSVVAGWAEFTKPDMPAAEQLQVRQPSKLFVQRGQRRCKVFQALVFLRNDLGRRVLHEVRV